MDAPPQIPISSHAVSVVVLGERGDDTRVLLLRRRGPILAGEWCQVAGGIEPGETGWQTALRELREETGLVPDRFYSADMCEQFYEAERDRISMLPVFVAFVDIRQPVTLNAEHSQFRWMSFTEAAAAVPFVGQRRMLAEIHREFVLGRPTELLRIDANGHLPDPR